MENLTDNPKKTEKSPWQNPNCEQLNIGETLNATQGPGSDSVAYRS